MAVSSTSAFYSNQIQLESRTTLPQGQQNGDKSLAEIEQITRTENKLRQVKRLYITLSQVNQTIVRVKEQDALFRTVCEVAVRFGEFSHAWIGILNEQTGDVCPVVSTGLDVNHWPFPTANIRTGSLSGGLVAQAILSSSLVTSGDVQADPNLQVLHDQFREHGYHSAAAIPIHFRGKTIGALTLMSEEIELFEDAEEVRLLEEMGSDISFALENMQIEKERRQAEEELRASKAKLEEALGSRTDTEKALRESQERYRLIAENAEDMIWTMNMNLQLTYVSPAVERALGYSAQEILSATPKQFLTAESFAVGLAVFNEEVQNAQPQPNPNYARLLELEYRRKDSSTFWVEMKFSFFRDSDGFPTGVLGVGREITERKRMHESLKQSEHVLRLFVEHSPASIAMFDRNMKYIVASRRYHVDYRLGQQELVGSSHYDVFPEIPERWKEIHQRCLQGGIEKADEDPFPREDGTLDWVRWEIRPWYEEGEKIGGIILFSEVITERKRVRDELCLLNVELEKRVRDRTLELSHANRAKDEFLANMSHELRTPLNTVLGLSESLLEQRRGPLNTRQIESVQLIAASGQHLLGLINDILEVSKIEAGKLELRPSLVSVKELCESSLNFIKEPALKKLISVEYHSEKVISGIYADPQRLKQILINLLTNAVKFTPEKGKVSLDVSTNEERDQILFSVTDTGIGIASEDLKKLFKPFTQLDSSLARQYTGTGLGLALVEKLTELHGGSVRVESELGKGSRFTIALPLNLQELTYRSRSMDYEGVAPDSVIASPHSQQGIILLAEDNAINAAMLADHLEEYGFEILRAENGEEALLKAAQRIPTAILMDIQMPKMDGLEAIRRLRADARFASTPIIALTALAMPGDRERCLEVGANEYLSKPVSLRLLVKTIQRLMRPEA
jgi:PAS domain S-box-containing protein